MPNNREWNFRSIDSNFPSKPSEHQNTNSTSTSQLGDGLNQNLPILSDSDDLLENEEENPPYKLIRSQMSRNALYSIHDFVSEFQMNSAINYPDEKLAKLIDEQIAIAIEKSEAASGNKMEKFAVLIFGHGLDSPVSLPLRPSPQNNANVVLNELEKLGQSDGEGGIDKRTLLLSHPIKILITCVNPPTGAGYVNRLKKSINTYRTFGLDEKNRLQTPSVDNPFCLFYALVLSRRYLDQGILTEHKNNFQKLPIPKSQLFNKWAFRRFQQNKSRMLKEVINLMNECKIPQNRQNYGIAELAAVQNYFDQTWPNMYRIVAFEHAPEIELKPIWKGTNVRQYTVPIFLQNGHWDGIKIISKFFKINRNYCLDCESTYDKDVNHTFKCSSRCYYCSSIGFGHPCPKEEGISIDCSECNRTFFNHRCFELHKTSTCRIWQQCTECDRVYQHDNKIPHKCENAYCKKCGVVHEIDRGCFLRKLVPPKAKAYRIAVFDVETRQDEELDERTQEHIVNFISLRITCTNCAENKDSQCEICGPIREKEWSEAEGDDCISDFVEWLLKAFDHRHDTLVYSHNGGRFDNHFVLRYLSTTGRFTEPQMCGLKIYEFAIKNSKKHSRILFRDSYLLMSLPLASLPKTFDLPIKAKNYFPYLFNKKENYNKRLSHLPLLADYCPETLNPERFEQIKKWYMENKDTEFYLPEKLKEYCRNDTEILLHAIIAFRKIFVQEVTNGIDLLEMSPTLAKLCMNIFSLMFVNDDTIAIIPERGYERQDRASVKAIQYLEYRALSDNVYIQHAGNGGEINYHGFKLDGYIPSLNKAIEFLGCYYHGCMKCFRPSDLLVNNCTAQELNEKTQNRIKKLREINNKGKNLIVEEIWECEVEKLYKESKEFRDFKDDLGNEKGPIDPRDAFVGGRTGPLCLLETATKKRKISIFDIISLYPYVNYTTSYPVGIPDIIRPKFDETNVKWSKPEHVPYRGLLKVRVTPPKGLKIPVIPLRMDDRLLFLSCYKCARHFKTSNTRKNHKCPHIDSERAFVTTITHLELEEALRRGYIVDRFYRAWHYTQWSDSLFVEYVRHFMRLKVEASGFPASVVSDEQKAAFVKKYKEELGIDIRLDKVKYNPGLRYISKICLNSLWGKFSQRNNMGQNIVLRDPSKFFDLVYDHRIEIDHISRVSEPAIRVHYRHKKQFVKENKCSNIVISLWTTSAARLVLLRYMDQVMKCPGAKLLYTDTDSIIVSHERGVTPLETGSMLGCMQSEYEDFEILEFTSGGAKQYGMRLKHLQTGKEQFMLKIRGITLDMANCKNFHYYDFKRMVERYGQTDPHFFVYKRIGPRKDSKVVTRSMEKRYLPVLQKGIIREDFSVVPFGYE